MNNLAYYEKENHFKHIFFEGFQKVEGSFVQIKTIVQFFENSSWFRNMTSRQRRVLLKGGLGKWIKNQIKTDNELKNSYHERLQGRRSVLEGYGAIDTIDFENAENIIVFNSQNNETFSAKNNTK